MAYTINLSPAINAKIEDFYKREIIIYGGPDLASNDPKWVDPPGSSWAKKGNATPYVMDPKFELNRVSYYLKKEGSNFNASSAQGLFELTKALAVPTSDAFKITRLTWLDYDPDGKVTGFPEQVGRQFPAGASTEDKRKIYKEKIYPGILDNYVAVTKDASLDPVIVRLIKEWWISSQDEIFNNYIEVAEETLRSGLYSVRDIDTYHQPQGMGGMGGPSKTAGIQRSVSSVNGSRIIKTDFFLRIITPGQTYLKSIFILEILGLAENLRDLRASDQSGIGRAYGGYNTVAALEALKVSDPEKFARIVATALDIPEATDEDKNNLNQCALITALVHGDPKFNFERYIEPTNGSNGTTYPSSQLQLKNTGHERIYPVQIDNYNPNKLINNCVINKNVKTIFNTSDTKTPHNMVKALFWVYEDKDNKLREAELTTNSTIHKKKVSAVLSGLTAVSVDAYKERLVRLDRIKDSSYYFLENTKINFDGTNPSTARNDVKVQMTWKLGSLEGLDSALAILGENDGLDPETIVTIKDLITLPITKKPSASDGPGQFITNQYSPNYSRLRLKVSPYGDEKATHLSDCMILDLAIIDHQVNRSSETGETTLTISYRGYFEATLNMPFNDVLASEKTRGLRAERQKKSLDILKAEGCKAETVREALRLEQEVFRSESAESSVGSILLMMQNSSQIHSYALNEAKIVAGTYGNVLDGTIQYVESVKAGIFAGLANVDVKTLSEVSKGEKDDDADKKALEASLEKLDKKFFFLGDLMWTLLGCLYQPHSADHAKAVKNINLRFMVGSIYIPDPKDLDGPPRTINPISAPIDLKFFVQWFNATIVSKGLTTYPVGTFIRDLVERLVNGVIYDTCFSLFLPDENPPLLRSRTFVSSNEDWFEKDKKGWFDPKDPFQNGNDPASLFQKNFISKHTSSNTWSQEVTSKNYCVIYQQFPSYKRQLAAENNKTLKEDEYTPTIYYGAKNKNYNFLSNVSFAKTNSPYLREARYFNTNYGGLSLLSNVYDLDFSFKRRKANTMFYPGCIINFVLLDWGQRWVDEPPWYTPNRKIPPTPGGFSINPVTHYFYDENRVEGSSPFEGLLGGSDPHKEGTMSNIMGMGGYFIIKSVEYNLGHTPGEFEIKISTKFLGTDATKAVSRTKLEDKKITDAEKCSEAFNIIANRYNEIGAGGMDVARRAVSTPSPDYGASAAVASERAIEAAIDSITGASSDTSADELVGDAPETDIYGTSNEDGTPQ